MSSRRSAAPGVVELLRLLVVLFFAGVGYQVGQVSSTRAHVLGPFDAVAVGVIIGSGVGFVLGGVLGRSTVSAVGGAESALRDLTAEGLIAGGLGALGGVVLASAVAWPLFLIRQALIAVPLFIFVVAVIALLGLRLAVARQQGVVGIIGPSAGLGPRPAAPSLLPRVLDTSVAVDGRILDVVRAGFLHGTLLVPTAVLGELQRLADSPEAGVRARGRRGLEVLQALKREPGLVVDVIDEGAADGDVDALLVRICQERRTALLTFDTTLAKVAALAGVQVLNLHALALSLRPPVVAGENIEVSLLKTGKEAGQAVGYLDDGTMVVVEKARAKIGHEVEVKVGSVLVTANGRLVFAQLVQQ